MLSEEIGINQTIECSEAESVLDAAEQQGLDLPYSCRTGACSSCVGKVTEGTVEQPDQTFLSDEQLEKGYVLTCIALPKSDCTILVHREDDVY